MTRSLWIRLVLAAVLLVSIPLSLNSPVTVTAAGIPDHRFGVVDAYAAPTEATELGAGWTRVAFEWDDIQPNGLNEWNLSISSRALDIELAQGRQVVGLLASIPDWATDEEIGPGVPRGLYLPADDPENLWANFVRTIVTRYAGRIDHWTIWDGPESPLESLDATWGGSIGDYIQLLRVAYTVAKEANPDAVIHTAAVNRWQDENWFDQFLDALTADPQAAANDYYFDVATLHIYFQPEATYDLTAYYHRRMQNRRIQKPIWIAEANAPPSQDDAWPVSNAQFNISLDEQAAFIIQAISLGVAAGAERIALYKMADAEADRAAGSEPFGLVRLDGSRRPAFIAYQMATTYLSGFQGGSWDRRDVISVVTIDRGQQTTIVVWARTPEPQTAMIPARTTQALRVDAQGGAHYVYPERGYYFLDLPGSNCTQGCSVGGAPFMLIEEAPVRAKTAPAPPSPTPSSAGGADPDATPDSNALPTPTPTFTPTPTPIPTPTSTPMPTDTPTPTPIPTNTPMPTTTPTLIPTPIPTPTPAPLPTSDIPPSRPWLLIGVLTLVIGGTAIVTDRSRSL